MTDIRTSVKFVDAYAGRETPVFLRVRDDGAPLFHAPDATTPRMFYASDAEAVRALGPELRCPYTGGRLRPVHDGAAVMFLGGWDPRRPVPRQEFLHFAGMRAGKSGVPMDAPRISPAVEDIPLPRSREVLVSQEALDAVKELTEPKRPRRRRSK